MSSLIHTDRVLQVRGDALDYQFEVARHLYCPESESVRVVERTGSAPLTHIQAKDIIYAMRNRFPLQKTLMLDLYVSTVRNYESTQDVLREVAAALPDCSIIVRLHDLSIASVAVQVGIRV